jgi:hypothetical protein
MVGGDKSVKKMFNCKIKKFLDCQYIVVGSVTHVTFLFIVVPKGDDSLSRLFGTHLGTVSTRASRRQALGFWASRHRQTEYIVAGTNRGDFDIGECWHSFMVHHQEDQPLFGVKTCPQRWRRSGDINDLMGTVSYWSPAIPLQRLFLVNSACMGVCCWETWWDCKCSLLGISLAKRTYQE